MNSIKSAIKFAIEFQFLIFICMHIFPYMYGKCINDVSGCVDIILFLYLFGYRHSHQFDYSSFHGKEG